MDKTDIPTIIYYKDNVFTNQELDFVKRLNYLDGEHQNKEISRKQLWFHNDNKYFCSIWDKRYDRWKSNEYFNELFNLQNKVQNILYNLELDYNIFSTNNLDFPNINSCLINYYKDGNDFIPPHRDTPLSFGDYPTIINVSFGETRNLILKNDKEKFTFELKSNSIFIMMGSSQKYYTHEIEKSDTIHPRYSLTFREHIN
jgi:alkylated DNA repair dioxygenase AlkB